MASNGQQEQYAFTIPIHLPKSVSFLTVYPNSEFILEDEAKKMKFLKICGPFPAVDDILAILEKFAGRKTLGIDIGQGIVLSEKHVASIAKTCPDLVFLKCMVHHRDLWLNSSSSLSKLEKLRSLHLHVKGDELRQMSMEGIINGMKSLKSLEFLRLTGAAQLNVDTIMALPNLTTLICHIEHPSDEFNLEQRRRQIQAIVDELAKNSYRCERTGHFHESYRCIKKATQPFYPCAQVGPRINSYPMVSYSGDSGVRTKLVDNVLRELYAELPKIPETEGWVNLDAFED